ncbi:hypothetical protein B7C51_06965 [Paenibacillus larvae subsp. pulvifaciens]|uniref:Uncharacterized protein n=1 Tax=Paenibacillus larvae subsp. pulvifaciens TaxID=1477 RepID=A0A1V0UQS9_9BACL|nr:hypothetical protein [Paenibacillus larvae]ARF67629.1 hypothetical protein B7C51_06965 [Paenibacillus larvae subsp. pulvifaciens]
MYKVNGNMSFVEKQPNLSKRLSPREGDFIFVVKVENGTLVNSQDKEFPFTSRTVWVTADNEKEALQYVRDGWGLVEEHI